MAGWLRSRPSVQGKNQCSLTFGSARAISPTSQPVTPTAFWWNGPSITADVMITQGHWCQAPPSCADVCCGGGGVLTGVNKWVFSMMCVPVHWQVLMSERVWMIADFCLLLMKFFVQLWLANQSNSSFHITHNPFLHPAGGGLQCDTRSCVHKK